MIANPANMLSILQGTKVYRVPIYQRRYSWVIEQWRLLWDDIQMKSAESDSNSYVRPHFIGNIVVQEQVHNESTVTQYLVIDGQQRLITIITLLAALRDALTKIDPNADANEYSNKYLKNPYDDDDPDRLVPTEFDQIHYIRTIHETTPSGSIGRCYKYFERQLQDLDVEQLKLTSRTILKHLQVILVETDLGDPVNTIFNTLNSRGRPLLPPDLIRNELFSHLDEEKSQGLYQHRWVPIERALVKTTSTGKINAGPFVTFFWSRELPYQPRLAKKSLYSAFETRLRQKLPMDSTDKRSAVAEIEIHEIWNDFELYTAAVDPNGTSSFEWPDDSLKQSVARLTRWGSDTHIPVTLWILTKISQGKITAEIACKILDSILGYIIARALVGIPSNSLNRVLSAVPARLENEAPTNLVKALFGEFTKSNNRWPGRESIAAAFEDYGFDGLKPPQIELVTKLANGDDADKVADTFQSPIEKHDEEDQSYDQRQDTIIETLQELTPYQYTTLEDISSFLRMDPESVRHSLTALDDSFLSLVRTEDDNLPDWITVERSQSLEQPINDSTRREHIDQSRLETILDQSLAEYINEAE